MPPVRSVNLSFSVAAFVSAEVITLRNKIGSGSVKDAIYEYCKLLLENTSSSVLPVHPAILNDYKNLPDVWTFEDLAGMRGGEEPPSLHPPSRTHTH